MSNPELDDYLDMLDKEYEDWIEYGDYLHDEEKIQQAVMEEKHESEK
jgi:hypothetical protein